MKRKILKRAFESVGFAFCTAVLIGAWGCASAPEAETSAAEVESVQGGVFGIGSTEAKPSLVAVSAPVKKTRASVAAPRKQRPRNELGKALRQEASEGEILVRCSARLPEDSNEYKEMCANFRVALLLDGEVVTRERFTPDGTLRFSVEKELAYRIRPLVVKTWRVEGVPEREVRSGESIELRFIQLAP
jgi:hypothetical protein